MGTKQSRKKTIAGESQRQPVERAKARSARQRPGRPAETTPLPAAVASGEQFPEYEEVARLAHSYWEARGCVGGSPEQDWFRAEREVKARKAASRAAAAGR
jgi:hypothetical protein